MSTFKDCGIVLRETPHGEYDKNLTVLLRDHGKAYLYVKGARRPKSKLNTGTEVFSFSNFIVYEGKGFNSVTQLELVDNFYNLRVDYDLFCCAANMLELTEKLMHPQMPSANALELLKTFFEAMCRRLGNGGLLRLAFTLKLLEQEGFRPFLRQCSGCGGELMAGAVFTEDGVCCRSCSKNYAEKMPVSKKEIDALSYIYDNEVSVLLNKNADTALIEKLSKVIGFFTDLNLDLHLKTKKMLNGGGLNEALQKTIYPGRDDSP